jgi:hypothetical protein
MVFMAEIVASKYEYMENLPSLCPPDSAALKAYAEVWRFVTSNPPIPSDFQSLAATKAPPPTVDPCRWASCSVFLTRDAAYKKLPKLRARYGFLAKITISDKCGFTDRQKLHMDFWRFKTFRPNVLGVEAI